MLTRIRSTLLALACAGAALALSGCAETQRPEATGEGSVRAINAIVESPDLVFRNEERSQGNVGFRGTVGFTDWDDLDYTFNFDLLLPDQDDPIRLASQFIDVVLDTEYSLALVGSLDDPSIIMWEDAERSWEGTEEFFEADFVHLSPMTGQVDVYFVLDGEAVVPGEEVGTLAFGERLPFREFPGGDYSLVLTAPNDPANVLFTGTAARLAPALRMTVALFDPDRSTTSPVGVNYILRDGSALTTSDINSPPQARLLNAVFGGVNLDGYFNNDFAAPVFSDVGFVEVSTYTDLTELVTPLTVTEAGNSGNVVIEQDLQFVGNSYRTMAVYELAGETQIRGLLDDARPLATFPVMRITSFASNIEFLDIYEQEVGTDIETVFPSFGAITPGVSTTYFSSREGMREISVTLTLDKETIATPLVVDLVNGQIIDIVIVDTADPAVVELLVLESVLP